MQQLDLFDLFEPFGQSQNSLDHAKIATKEDVLKVQTALLLDYRVKASDKIKAAELICKINGYLTTKAEQSNSDTTPQPVQIVFNTIDARLKPSSD